MAIKRVDTKKLDNVIIVSKNDDAIDEENSDWDAYLEDYKMDHLSFLADKEPTKLVCNFRFSASEIAEVKNSMMSSINKSTSQPNLSVGSYQQNIARFGLKDIQNPEYVPAHDRLTLKKNGKHLRDDSIEMLEQYGLVDEIFTAYTTLTDMNQTHGNEKN